MRKKSILVRNEAAPVVKPVKEVQTFTMNFLPKQVRFETLEDRTYTVVPMVILTEGVHNGSNGALYYPPDELSKTPEVWDHKPIVVYHPELNGQGISACQPDVINSRKVGLMMNTKWDKRNNRLKSEAWIEAPRAEKVDERVMAAITKNEMMEVSTGVFIDKEDSDGEWKGEEYDGIARNFRPDHLAILPDQIGACSIKDGAGLLRNAEKQDPSGKLSKRVLALLKELGITDNELSFDSIRTELTKELRDRLNIKEGPNQPWCWIVDVYSNYIIYEYDGKTFRLGYTSTKLGATLDDEAPVEVKREIKYRTVEDAKLIGNRDQSKKAKTMTAEQRKQKIDGLIANKDSGWSEEDRSVLEALKDEKLEAQAKAFETKAPATNTTTTQPAAAVTAPAAVTTNAAPTKSMTREEWMALAPAGFDKVVELVHNGGLDFLNEEKNRLIEVIANHETKPFTKEQLQNRPLGELRTLARMAAPKAPAQQAPGYYGGMAPLTDNSGAGDEEALELPTMNFEAPVAKK